MNGFRRLHKFTDPEIRTKILAAAREALSEAPGGPMFIPAESPTPDGKGLQSDYLVSSAGVFRLPLVEFGIDWSDPIKAESFMAEVQSVLDAELPGRPAN